MPSMTIDSLVRPEALDYVAGLTLDPAALPPRSEWAPVPLSGRRLEMIQGVGVTDHDTTGAFATEALLAGLAGERIPFAFQVTGGPGGVSFMAGTWGGADGGTALDAQLEVVTSLLGGIYPRVERRPASAELRRLAVGGIVHGIPSAYVGADQAPWDRLVRQLRGSRFAVLVLAEPIEPATLAQLRDIAMDDLRTAVSAQDGQQAAPLTDAYRAQIDELVGSLNRALGSGGWRTGVYLLGDGASYWRLAAGWRGQFADADQLLSPLRVVESDDASELAGSWALPYRPAPRGPRLWRHPFVNQTLLDSRQLSAIAHFPRLDTTGFSVRPAPAFSVSRVTPVDSGPTIDVGDVLDQQTLTGRRYELELDQLTRHAFVAGLTGAGKTNTLMHILTEATAADVPFLVIEPAKTEYRELLGRPELADGLRVFTLGRERISPLRLNPFEVPEGVDVATHVDLLKAVFMSSFAMWTPLPQVLEQCLVELYTERGWDFAGVERPDGPSTVPTLGELVTAVERTVPTLGYKPDSTREITASLTTRLNSLRRGSRGLMLDVERSIPMHELLSGPTIIELEALGDDADKAFVMGLLLVRLYEHRRAEHAARLAAAAAAGQPTPPVGRLAHIVVLEEAHRLLAMSNKPVDAWHADPQGAFADAFSQMLSEVRAYGQAMVIADQVPVRLAPDVLKNTNLKIAHRLVAADDRTAMAGAMSMDAEQANVLSTLPRGQAAVFSEGDYTPLIVAVRKAKDLAAARAIDDRAVREAMATWRSRPEGASLSAHPAYCFAVCRTPVECRHARELAEGATARVLATRLFNTMISDADGLDVVWPDVVAFVSARTPIAEEVGARLHAFALHALHAVLSRRATQGRWPPANADALEEAIRDAIAERTRVDEPWLGMTPARQAVLERAGAVIRRRHDPYPLCASICKDGTCRYRDSVADLLQLPRHSGHARDLATKPDADAYAVNTAGYVAGDVVATAADAPGAARLVAARWRALGCAAQLLFVATDQPRHAAELVANSLASAGWNGVRVGNDPAAATNAPSS